MPTDLKILIALFEKRKLNKRSLDRYTGVHPKITQNHLKTLVKEGVVLEEGEHALGKKLFYSLTVKGEAYLHMVAVDHLNVVFKSVRRITSGIASNPDKLKQFREDLKENPPLTVTAEIMQRGYFTREEIDKHMENVERTHAPLTEAYKIMRKIYLEVWGPRKTNGELQDVAIALTKEGYIYSIPVSLLKKHGLGLGL